MGFFTADVTIRRKLEENINLTAKFVNSLPQNTRKPNLNFKYNDPFTLWQTCIPNIKTIYSSADTFRGFMDLETFS